jgi:hypothetical protein
MAQFPRKQRWAIMPHMPPLPSDPQYASLNRLETVINHLFTHQTTVERSRPFTPSRNCHKIRGQMRPFLLRKRYVTLWLNKMGQSAFSADIHRHTGGSVILSMIKLCEGKFIVKKFTYKILNRKTRGCRTRGRKPAVVTMHVMKSYGGVKVWIHSFLTHVQDWGDWPASRSCRFTHWKIAPSAHSLKFSVGSRTRLLTGEKENLFLCWESSKKSTNTHPDAWWIYIVRYVGVFHIAEMCDVTVMDWGASGYSQCWTGVKIQSWSS